jgi:DNA-binding NarL/FixJ family response regulator
MAQLVGFIVSHDDAFKTQIGRLLRSGAIPVSIIDDRLASDNASLDLVIVDTRGDASSAMSTIERLRGAAPHAGIFVIALQADPELILQSMRAGANEFFTWPPPEQTFHGAIRRTAARRESTLG